MMTQMNPPVLLPTDFRLMPCSRVRVALPLISHSPSPSRRILPHLLRHPHVHTVFQDDGLISLRRCEIRGHGFNGVSPDRCALDVEQIDARRFGIADHIVLNADAL